MSPEVCYEQMSHASTAKQGLKVWSSTNFMEIANIWRHSMHIINVKSFLHSFLHNLFTLAHIKYILKQWVNPLTIKTCNFYMLNQCFFFFFFKCNIYPYTNIPAVIYLFSHLSICLFVYWLVRWLVLVIWWPTIKNCILNSE